jgi:hypothetical protein
MKITSGKVSFLVAILSLLGAVSVWPYYMGCFYFIWRCYTASFEHKFWAMDVTTPNELNILTILFGSSCLLAITFAGEKQAGRYRPLILGLSVILLVAGACYFAVDILTN